MKHITLLLWISATLMLVVCGSSENEFSHLCEECNETTYPKCGTEHLQQLNQTVYCEQPSENSCTLGIVQLSENDNADIVCLIERGKSSASTEETSDGIKVISIVKEPLSTMKPIPLALQMTASEDIPTETSWVEETTIAHATDTSPTELAHIKPISEEAAENPLNKPELTDEVVASTPIESLDYQGDAANTMSENTVDEVPENPDLEEKVTIKEAVNTTSAPVSIQVIETVEEPKKATDLPNLKPINHLDTVTVGNILSNNVEEITTSASNTQFMKCFGCLSTNDKKCSTKPVKEIDCKASPGARNGCYTLFKVDNNITTRGCISDLTEDGMSYCQSNTKLCSLCYEQSCNRQAAAGAASPQHNFNVLVYMVLATLIGRAN